MNHKKVERIWKREGLKVPQKQPKRKGLWLNDGYCFSLRPEHEDYVWSYYFVMAKTTDGKALQILNIINKYTRKSISDKMEAFLYSFHL